MIVDERLITYINSLDQGNTGILEAIEAEALAAHVPIVRKEMQGVLKTVLAMTCPGHILEVGTAVGFSTLLMAQYNPAACHITTIENYEKRIPMARDNFKRAAMEEKITLLEGDAAEILPTLTEVYDFIFMDAAKGQYIYFLPEIMRLLAPGGILVSDNVLQEGDILDSHYIVPRRNRTIHKRMREYLYELTHREDLTTSILPVGDGITLSVKRKRQ
ncbi:MAG: O-methyltransferase [Lachnospiraceae bacterium]|nr:O-methyltransferase [Lachnospiraceae bacterium]